MFKEFPYYIDKKLKHKLDLLTTQLEKKDVWILLDGDEGSGKTNMAAFLLYYFHCSTGRELTIDNFYFDAENLFEYAKSTKEKLLNWDEAALGGLSTEWWTRAQVNIIKLALTGRKLHHVFILCIPRFDKLKEDLRRDRIHALIHMNTGKLNNRYGHYIYLTRRGIRYLNDVYKKKRMRFYGQAMRKGGGHGGSIQFVFNKVFNKDDINKYEKNKDDAINNIGAKKVKTAPLKPVFDNQLFIKKNNELRKFKYIVATIPTPIKTRGDLAKAFGITHEGFNNWRSTYAQFLKNQKVQKHHSSANKDINVPQDFDEENDQEIKLTEPLDN